MVWTGNLTRALRTNGSGQSFFDSFRSLSEFSSHHASSAGGKWKLPLEGDATVQVAYPCDKEYSHCRTNAPVRPISVASSVLNSYSVSTSPYCVHMLCASGPGLLLKGPLAGGGVQRGQNVLYCKSQDTRSAQSERACRLVFEVTRCPR